MPPKGYLAPETRAIRDRAYLILEERKPATVRHVCYQLFNVYGLIPDVSKKSTDKVSKILTRARQDGIVPFAWIVDETREIEALPTWDDPSAFFERVAGWYRADRWADQDTRVIVVSEKSTVAGILRPVLRKWAVPFVSYHGHTSTTAIHDLAEMSVDDDRPLVVLYAGDHDPSGRHMSDVDIPNRLKRYGGKATVRRLAVTPEQIEGLTLPTFSAHEKKDDKRQPWFLATHGTVCCELDALNPNVLRNLLDEAIAGYVDQDAWKQAERVEAVERASIREWVAGFPGVA